MSRSATAAPPRPASVRNRVAERYRAIDRLIDWRLLLAALVVLSALYLAWQLDRGWVAHDEGTLAQSAERLLQGELPHRDFDELYTGGLTWLNAAAFRPQLA